MKLNHAATEKKNEIHFCHEQNNNKKEHCLTEIEIEKSSTKDKRLSSASDREIERD